MSSALIFSLDLFSCDQVPAGRIAALVKIPRMKSPDVFTLNDEFTRRETVGVKQKARASASDFARRMASRLNSGAAIEKMQPHT